MIWFQIVQYFSNFNLIYPPVVALQMRTGDYNENRKKLLIIPQYLFA